MEDKPDFPEWIKTKAGQDCLDISTLESQTFLFNRLFWAFDAGRDCIWSQYLEMKKQLEEKDKEIERLKDEIENLGYELREQGEKD